MGELFTDGEDVVVFYDDDDMMRKIDYYISHDEERKQIVANGQKKILENYDYSKAWKYIFDVSEEIGVSEKIREQTEFRLKKYL